MEGWPSFLSEEAKMADGPINPPNPEAVTPPKKTSLRHLEWRARLQYFYLLRVPILIAITIFFFPIISLTSLRQLLGNLFVVDLWNIFWTMIATEMLVLGLMVVFRVVLLNGNSRFGIPQALSEDVVRKKSIFLPQLLLLPMLWELVRSNGQANNLNDAFVRSGIAILGTLVAGLAAFVMLWLSVLFSPRYPNPNKKADPRYPPHKRFYLPFEFMRRWIDWACDWDWLTPKTRERIGQVVRTWPNHIRAGYFDPETCLPYPGQLFMIGMLILSWLLYRGIGSLKHYLRPGESFGIPAIAYLVVLLIVLNWLLSVASFFLDHFWMPLLLPAAAFVLSTNFFSLPSHLFGLIQPFVVVAVSSAWLLALASFLYRSLLNWRRFLLIVAFSFTLAANLISSSDHFYEIRPAQSVPTIDPSQVLGAGFRLNPDNNHPNGRLTLIATAGGGIQAAAWTARVLTGLQQEVKADTPSASFANSIAAISSVSGGAVGTMFFVDRYQTGGSEQGFPAGADLSNIVDDAQAPALSDIAWAMVYPDLTRAIIPFSTLPSARLIDRGWALEQTWRRRENLNATLNDWRNGVTDGFRPAVIFNSTIVESGEPLLLATTDLHEQQISGPASKTLPTLLPGYDVPIVTAVRLAASFPFVTPASRALYDPGPERSKELEAHAKYHVVDGGYYDNYGIYGLLQFLGQALKTTPKDKIPDILILQIRSFPTETSQPGQSEGWFFQSWAPLSALLDVRTSAQLLRDREALGTFVALWSARGVKIRLATFEFQGGEAPLSWQMNQPQIDEIQSEWKKRIAGPDNQDWQQVNCFFHPQSKECQSVSQLVEKGAW
jgi:hypothetical protein